VLINLSRLRLYALICLAIMLMAIFIGGTQPGAGSLFLAPWDKVAHFVTYGMIGVFAGLAWPAMPLAGILMLVGCTGMADEIHQLFLVERVPGWDDFAADVIGGLLVLPVIVLLRRRLPN
jgi:VanZ family protein